MLYCGERQSLSKTMFALVTPTAAMRYTTPTAHPVIGPPNVSSPIGSTIWKIFLAGMRAIADKLRADERVERWIVDSVDSDIAELERADDQT